MPNVGEEEHLSKEIIAIILDNIAVLQVAIPTREISDELEEEEVWNNETTEWLIEKYERTIEMYNEELYTEFILRG